MAKMILNIKKLLLLATPLFVTFGGFVYSLSASVHGTAILVTKETYADAAVAMTISSNYNVPVFFVNPNNVSQNLIQELRQDNITNLIIIGGPVVISHNVSEELRSLGFNVTRIWGVTRYETSAYANLFFYNKSDYAVIVTRDIVGDHDNASEASELAVADEFAVKNHYPLFITPDGELSNSVSLALKELGVKHVYLFTLQESHLGQIPSQLSSLNISYNLYIGNSFEALNSICGSNIRSIYVPGYVKWEDIRYTLFLGSILNGTACIYLIPVKNVIEFNDTKYKLEYKDQENALHGLLRAEDVIKLHLDRLLGLEEEKLQEMNITCDAIGYNYPICQKLPEIEARINESIKNINIALSNLNETITILEKENNYSLDLDNHYGLYVMPLNIGLLNRFEHDKEDIENEIKFELGGNFNLEINGGSGNNGNSEYISTNMNLSVNSQLNNKEASSSIYSNFNASIENNQKYNSSIYINNKNNNANSNPFPLRG